MKITRNKNCIECPQNKREDIVWRKGYQDGFKSGMCYVEALIDKKLRKKIS